MGVWVSVFCFRFSGFVFRVPLFGFWFSGFVLGVSFKSYLLRGGAARLEELLTPLGPP